MDNYRSSFGLSINATTLLSGLLKQCIPQGEVRIYGSRAKGNFSERSDVDLVICNAGTTDWHLLGNLKDIIEESDFPYLCDIQYLETIKNQPLLDHIDRIGRVFYQKELL